MKIHLNGEEIEVSSDTLSFEDITELAYGVENRGKPYSVIAFYRKHQFRDRSLITGQVTNVVEGLAIECIMTDNA